MTALSIKPENTGAILIGMGEFSHASTLYYIPMIKANLDKLTELLTSDIIGIPPGQIVRIENQADIIQQIEAQLPKISDKQLETLIVYYVGHGIPKESKSLYLAHKDTSTPLEQIEEKSLSFAGLLENTRKRAKNLIYWLDCCYSGLALKEGNLLNKGQHIAILTAADATSTIPAGNGTYTTFTHGLIELLEKGVVGKGETWTTSAFREALKKQLPTSDGYEFLKTASSVLHFAYNRASQPVVVSSQSIMSLYLLIALELKTKKPRTYLFQTWLKKGEDIPKRIHLERNVTPLKGILTLIENSLRKIQQEVEQNGGKLTLEFFLPTELLNHNVEEWRPGSDYPIGVDYSVTVRPLERIGKYDRRSRLCRYWKKNRLEDTVTNCAKWLETADHDGLLPILDRGYVFLGLNFVPDKAFFKELVNSGTPIALWIRQETAKQLQCDLYHQEFCRCRLEELPERLRQKRTEIWGSSKKGHTGHLSLLWDDPDRIPEEWKKLSGPD